MAKQDLISTHMSMSTLQGSSKFETTNDPKSISINIPMLCNMLIKILKIVAERLKKYYNNFLFFY